MIMRVLSALLLCSFVGCGDVASNPPKTDGNAVDDVNRRPSYETAHRLLRDFELESAVMEFTRLIDSQESVCEALVGRGRAQMLLYQDESAKRDFAQAIEINEHCAAAYAARATGGVMVEITA